MNGQILLVLVVVLCTLVAAEKVRRAPIDSTVFSINTGGDYTLKRRVTYPLTWNPNSIPSTISFLSVTLFKRSDPHYAYQFYTYLAPSESGAYVTIPNLELTGADFYFMLYGVTNEGEEVTFETENIGVAGDAPSSSGPSSSSWSSSSTPNAPVSSYSVSSTTKLNTSAVYTNPNPTVVTSDDSSVVGNSYNQKLKNNSNRKTCSPLLVAFGLSLSIMASMGLGL